MIDRSAREKALALLHTFESGCLSVDEFENEWPKDTRDLGVRSIGFWMWTLYSDDDDGAIQGHEDREVRQVTSNAISFLSSEVEFVPRKAGAIERIRKLFSAGIEWKDCELPWHEKWPFKSM